MNSLRSLLTLSIVFAFLSKLFGNLIAESDRSVEEIIREAAGVYLDNTIAKRDGLEKTILITASNFGYMDMVQNLACFIKLHNLKMLFIAMDQKAYDSVPTNIPNIKRVVFLEGTEVGTDVYSFREGQFNDISFRKLKVVLSLLKHGYDVIFFDSDIAILENPVPLLVLKQFDYVFQQDHFCGLPVEAGSDDGNTGVYYMRANSETRNLLVEVINAGKT